MYTAVVINIDTQVMAAMALWPCQNLLTAAGRRLSLSPGAQIESWS